MYLKINRRMVYWFLFIGIGIMSYLNFNDVLNINRTITSYIDNSLYQEILSMERKEELRSLSDASRELLEFKLSYTELFKKTNNVFQYILIFIALFCFIDMLQRDMKERNRLLFYSSSLILVFSFLTAYYCSHVDSQYEEMINKLEQWSLEKEP